MSRAMLEEGVGLSDIPGHLLRRCHQISVALFLEECERFDLTPLQFSVLKTLLDLGPQDQATLGGHAALDRTTVAVVVGKLEERGLVRRAQSSRDRRSKIVSITGPGMDLVAESLPHVMKAQTRTVAPLEEEETAELMRLLGKLAEGNNAASRAPFRRARSETV